MAKFLVRYSLVVFLATWGFSSVANATTFITWKAAHEKLDCLRTCKAADVGYPIATSRISIKNSNKYKPISICAAKKSKRSKVLAGYNIGTGAVEAESSCIISVKGKEYHSKKYYCLCTNILIQPLQ